MNDDCTNTRRVCDSCEKEICRRCGRCFEMQLKFGTNPPPTRTYRCPSRICRSIKRFVFSAYRLGDTPRTGVCTDE